MIPQAGRARRRSGMGTTWRGPLAGPSPRVPETRSDARPCCGSGGRRAALPLPSFGDGSVAAPPIGATFARSPGGRRNSREPHPRAPLSSARRHWSRHGDPDAPEGRSGSSGRQPRYVSGPSTTSRVSPSAEATGARARRFSRACSSPIFDSSKQLRASASRYSANTSACSPSASARAISRPTLGRFSPRSSCAT